MRSPASTPRGAQGAAGAFAQKSSQPPSAHAPLSAQASALVGRLPPIMPAKSELAPDDSHKAGRDGLRMPLLLWDFEVARVQLLDRASLKCDRSFDVWNQVQLHTPARRTRVPNDCEAPNAFHSEGLHRIPRPPLSPAPPRDDQPSSPRRSPRVARATRAS